MRILITGGAGFIGSHLCDLFLAEGHEVIAMDNLITGSIRNIEHLAGNERFRFIKQDVTEYLYLDGPLDAVLHFASPASPKSYIEYPIQTLKVGALGTHKALGLARAKGARFLLASTSEIYGDPLVHPQREGYWGNVNPIGPRGVYDEAKRFAEAMTMAYHRYHGVETRIARIFNSILADETVILFDGDQCHLTSIGAFADSIEEEALTSRTIFVPAFDPQACTISLRKVNALIKHPNSGKEAYQVTTRYGRRIKVTGDHSLFKKGKDGQPVAVPVRQLRVGEYIAIPAKLPVIERDLTVINIAEHLLSHCSSLDELWDYALMSPELKGIIAEHKEQILQILENSDRFTKGKNWKNTIGCAYRKYLNQSTLPLYVIKALRRYTPIPLPDDAKIRLYNSGARVLLPNKIEVTNDLLWLLGLFVAEGSLSISPNKSYYLSLCSDEEYLNRAKAILETTFNVHVGTVAPTRTRGPSIYAHSKLLCLIFDQIFDLDQRSSKNKKIPSWIFQLPLSRLKFFLEGYRQGNGTHSGDKLGNELCFDTVSEELATDLTLLLLRFGIVASVGQYETTFKKRYGERKFPFYRITICELSNFDVLTWDEGVEQTLNASRTGDLVWALVRSIERCESTSFVYDFSVPGAENFVAGNGVCCHNTYGPRMALDDGRVVPSFIGQALRGEPLTVHGDGSQTRSFCYISDMIDGIHRLLLSDEVGPVNLGNPNEITILEFARKINEITGNPAGIVYRPRPPDDPSRRCPDISKARRVLGWEPRVGLEEGLERTIAWFRKQMISG